MTNKIDQSLLNIKTLSCEEEVCCLVYSSQLEKLESVINHKGLGKVRQKYPFLSACEVQLKKQHLHTISRYGMVKYMTSSTKVATMVNVGRSIIGMGEDWQSSSFTCAVIDTGCDSVIDLMVPQKKIVAFVDLINEKPIMYDDNGHGTMVVSAITGTGVLSGKRYEGMTNTPCIMLKALDAKGETSSFTILKAMQWIMDHKDEFNIKVVCMSFGSIPLEKYDPLVLGAEVLWDNGITVVAACGNSGPEAETVRSPGISTKIITVGAMDDGRVGDQFDINQFSIADFSSRGPAFGNYKPDMIASGVDVVTSCAFHLYNEHYCTMSGTSIATPLVAGAVCRLLQQYPTYTPDMIKRMLIGNCHPVTHDRNQEGFGYLSFQKEKPQ